MTEQSPEYRIQQDQAAPLPVPGANTESAAATPPAPAKKDRMLIYRVQNNEMEGLPVRLVRAKNAAHVRQHLLAHTEIELAEHDEIADAIEQGIQIERAA